MHEYWARGAAGSLALVICVQRVHFTSEDFRAAVEMPFIRVHSRFNF
jgi:hypothetical protein